MLFMTGGRFETLRFLLALFVVASFKKRVRNVAKDNWIKLIVTSVALAGGFYVLVGSVRSAAGVLIAQPGNIYNHAIDSFYSTNWSDPLMSAYYLPNVSIVSISIYEFPENQHFLHGKTFMSALDVWVPDVLYWSKFPNVNMGSIMRGVVHGDRYATDSGVFSSFIGELYANFSYIGVFIGMSTLGFVVKLFTLFIESDKESPWKRSLYAIVVCIFIPMLLVVNSKPASFKSVYYFIFLLASFVVYRLSTIGKTSVL